MSCVQKPGSHGDVFKHLVFCETIKAQQKEHPEGIILVDCHAGKGLNDLSKQPDGAFNNGVARVIQCMDESSPKPVQNYVAAVRQADEYMQHYPGSPFLGARLLRDQDEHRLVDKEIEDVEGLNDGALFWQTDVFDEDALDFLVPDDDSRHPVILIDPEYEDLEDFYRAKILAFNILKKNPLATIVMFYPLIENTQWRYGWAKIIKDQVKKPCKKGIFTAWFTVDKKGYQGDGMMVVNPSKDFDYVVDEETIDWLSATLLNSGRSDYSLDMWMKKKKPKV